MQTLQQFIATWNHRYCDFDRAFGAQCVDPADQYLRDVWGVPVFYVTGAVDLFGHRPDLIEWILNDVGNSKQFPQPGDMVIWHLDHVVGTGVLGHVDIFVSGNGMAFTGFDQNWPVGAPCHLQAHNYEGVKGWGRLRPRPVNPTPGPAPISNPAPVPVSAPPAAAPAPAPRPASPPGSDPSQAPTPTNPAPPTATPPTEVPPVQNPPAPDPTVVVAPVVPPPIPEPAVVAEQGVSTSEWKLVIAYAAQAAAVGTADLVDTVSKAIWHVSVTIPPDLLQLLVNLEFAGAIGVAGYAVSRGIRKLGVR